jgi:Flp pilus assembly protein TadG
MKSARGTSMIEMLAGAIVLVPILFLAVDGAYVMICSKSNQELADHAARIAANKTTSGAAMTAATNIVAAFKKTDNMDSVKIERMDYDQPRRLVRVLVGMNLHVPVPLPGFSNTHLSAESVHPIVGIPAPR